MLQAPATSQSALYKPGSAYRARIAEEGLEAQAATGTCPLTTASRRDPAATAVLCITLSHGRYQAGKSARCMKHKYFSSEVASVVNIIIVGA